MTDLGVLPGGTFSTAVGINNRRQAVGSGDSSSGTDRAILFANGTATDLGTLPGGTGAEAAGINNRGQAVGFSTDSSGATHAVLFESGAVIDLGFLPGGNFSRTTLPLRCCDGTAASAVTPRIFLRQKVATARLALPSRGRYDKRAARDPWDARRSCRCRALWCRVAPLFGRAWRRSAPLLSPQSRTRNLEGG